jgi:predicted nucleic acid-binding protein
MKIFVDTSALFAALDAADPNHADAADALRRLPLSDELVTHNYVHLEADALVRRRLGRDAAADLADRLLPGVTTIWVDEPTHRAAAEALRAAGGQGSLVDHVSFVVMRREGISEALAYDLDFEANGFPRPAAGSRPPAPRRMSESATPYASDDGVADLVSVAELAARSGRSVNTIQSWRRRHADFPDPVASLAAGPVWTWPIVERWITDRATRGTRGTETVHAALRDVVNRRNRSRLAQRDFSELDAALPELRAARGVVERVDGAEAK